MSMTLMAQAMKMKVGSTARKLVLLKLADNANDKGECFPSYQHIADQCEMSRRSVINHIDALCEQGLIKKIYRNGEKGNSSNFYILNLSGEKSAPRISHSFEPVIEPKDLNTQKTVQQNTVEKISRYAFEGKVIRLNHKDFDDWQKLYPNLDLPSELLRLDIEYQHDKPKKWFIRTSQKLNYQNKQVIKQMVRNSARKVSGFVTNFSHFDYGQTEIPSWAEA
ncbi:MAG: helix-turn-helix domain-containing protein [Candidatus Phlomobacter fragariae]